MLVFRMTEVGRCMVVMCMLSMQIIVMHCLFVHCHFPDIKLSLFLSPFFHILCILYIIHQDLFLVFFNFGPTNFRRLGSDQY